MTDQRVVRVSCGLLRHPDGGRGILMGMRLPTATRPNLWEYPGGKLEPGESPGRAVAREWQEELGLGVRSWSRIATGSVDADVRVMIDAFEVAVHRVDLVRDSPGKSVDTYRGMRACLRGLELNFTSHSELRWVDPDYAAIHLPCSPAFYQHLPWIRFWLDDLEAAGLVAHEPAVAGAGFAAVIHRCAPRR